MLNVEKDGNRAILDLRSLILSGAHPRGEVFEYVKNAEINTIFEIHTPRLPKPLINGLENMGLHVIVNELASDDFQIITVKTEEL